ncbi:FhuF 2Fe-2S C-terminal domain-containing protein [Marinobacter daqiaonensis]|uniref:FhuF 2Fe-2S C-terminal domain-containing protein n=1 Tax=Marinobacter daqiaonensis TaxID=650891 RepID=A0A1I6J9J0_9GAMM|nr:(2Fe-2S)-binding protein [Marinobacter daqiaonensis]SFR75588.1 FhuF 2Fe-2S C-terminal domain-containing protein [Marinobacter daqiaonensis]
MSTEATALWAPAEDWPQRYDRLLASTGMDSRQIRHNFSLTGVKAGETVSGALLRQWMEENGRAERELMADSGATGPRALVIQASVAQRDLCLQVLGPLTTRLLLDGHSPAPTEDWVIFRESGTESRWTWQESGTEAPGEAGIPEWITLVSATLRRWYPWFRKELGLSPGAFWSSAALGLSAPFSALYNTADSQTLTTLASEWLNQFDCDVTRYLEWLPATFQGQQCAIPQRRGCCLDYLLPEGRYCGTCGVFRKERLATLHPNQSNTATTTRPT